MDSSSGSFDYKLCENLETWMTDLPKTLKNVPLIHLAIPGSHDSFTCSIRSRSKISPDAGGFVETFKCLGPVLGVIVSRWVRTQEFNVLKQLQAGIRYFDLRISTKDGTEQLFFVHGQYSDDVVSVLNDIENFLDEYQKEVVIIDCQHFYDFTRRDHERLIKLLKATFGPKLLPYTQTMDHVTLGFMTEKCNYQVILIYRSDVAKYNQPFFWPSASFPTPWPDTTSPRLLVSKLNEGLSTRSPKTGFVTQFVLTPTTGYICKRLLSSLKSTCAIPLEKIKYDWLAAQSPGPRGLNIMISDFVEMNQSKFSKEVISLNEKYLDNTNIGRNTTLTPIDK